MADTDQGKCIICCEDLEGKQIRRIGSQAIQSLIKASEQIGDKKYKKLEGLAFLNIHNSCRVTYVRPSHIAAAKAAVKEGLSSLRKGNKEARNFDFSSLCLFCATDAVTNTHRRPIKIVTNEDFADNILKKLDILPEIDFNRKLRQRLKFGGNLNNKNARYHAKCLQKFHIGPSPTKVVGRPMSDNMSRIVQHIINHILTSDDSQFSLKELLQDFRDNLPSINSIKNHLENYFGNDIIMHSVPFDTIICFINKTGRELNNDWYKEKAPTEEAERLRIVEMAANIILQDVRSTRYDTSAYRAPSSFLDDIGKDVPPTLQHFLDTLIKTNNRSESKQQGKWSKRVLTLAHIIISFIRPRTFLSSILLGLSSLIHRKFAAKTLVDTLCYLGLCASYRETQLFESSIVNDPEQFEIANDAFVQFTFDNDETVSVENVEEDNSEDRELKRQRLNVELEYD